MYWPWKSIQNVSRLVRLWNFGRKSILDVMGCNPTVQCICSHFSGTAELQSAACWMHLAHAIFYVHNPPMAQKLWFRIIWHKENDSYMLWNVIQHCNVFVAILIALLNCIRWHVECIWHMPYSMFITLLWFKYCDSEWYGTQKMNLTCCGMYLTCCGM